MIIVSNTTPLSELAKVGKMHLLQEIFGRVIIPQQVYLNGARRPTPYRRSV